ncbi:MAG: hypothetical protein RDU76_06185 [Candidatus Edwardsbacteria bacterium]|nr:hypothetical protein [Candidatus Edwardsbacteria bacterium]
MRQTIILILALATVAGAEELTKTTADYWHLKIPLIRPRTYHIAVVDSEKIVIAPDDSTEQIQTYIFPTKHPPQVQDSAFCEKISEIITIADIKAYLAECHNDSTVAYGIIKCPHQHKKTVDWWDRWDCVMDGNSCVCHYGNIVIHKQPTLQGFVDWWERRK